MKISIFIVAVSFLLISFKSAKNEPEPHQHTSPNKETNFAWPVKVSDNHRYLTDSNAIPFPIFADTGWDLMCATSVEDGKFYIDDRANKNFNTIFTCLARPSDKSTIEMVPFYNDNLLTPNDEFFNRCREYIFHAQQKGITMILIPFWASAFREKTRLMTEAQLKELGRYYGRKFKDFPNIIWAVGGDFTPENPTDIDNMNWFAQGLNEEDTVHLLTYFMGGARGSWQFYNDAEWLDFHLYQIKAVDSHWHYNKAKEGYQIQPDKPVLYGEACYEYYQTGQKWPYCTDLNTRRAQYWALTFGACGYTYGRRGVWGFDAAGSYGYILDGHWKSLLDSKGADNITKVAGLYSEIDWEKLEPDFDEKFILPVSSSDAGKITTALANDGTFGIAYFPESRSATLDLTRITVGKKVKAQWFDPTSGEYAEVTGSPFKKENRSFTTPGNNSDGDPDWVLIVSSD
jgi:hypothetical protein